MAEDVTHAVLHSLICTGGSLLIKECMKSGMIFHRYYVLLVYLHIKWRHKRHKKRFFRQMLKPAGLCVYCYSFWVCLFSYAIIYGWSLWVLSAVCFQFIFIKTFISIWQD